MALEFGLCGAEDMPRCFEIMSLAFGNEHAYIEALFPKHESSPEIRAAGARFLARFLENPAARLCKVTDTATAQIVGFAKWDVYENGNVPDVGPKSLQGDHWKTADEKEYADYIWWEFTRRRWEAIRESGGDLVCLDIMTVDPAYHRRGVGRLLMKYGIDEADRLGVDAVVEASRMGRYLYETFGFKILEDVLIPNPPKQAGQQEQFIHWMRRPATAAVRS